MMIRQKLHQSCCVKGSFYRKVCTSNRSGTLALFSSLLVLKILEEWSENARNTKHKLSNASNPVKGSVSRYFLRNYITVKREILISLWARPRSPRDTFLTVVSEPKHEVPDWKNSRTTSLYISFYRWPKTRNSKVAECQQPYTYNTANNSQYFSFRFTIP